MAGIGDMGQDGILFVGGWDFDRDGWLQLKIQLYIKRDSRSDLLVRFLQLDGDGTGASTYHPDGVSPSTFSASRANELPGGWWNWLYLPEISAHGCYGLQLDTAEWSEQIIFPVVPADEQ